VPKDDVSGNPYAISSQDFESFLDYIAYRGVATITVNQGLDLGSPPAPLPSVAISPTHVRMYVEQPRTFSSSITDGNPPFMYQWYRNGTAVPGATGATWTFTPATAGHYMVYVNVSDGDNFRVQSDVAHVLACSSYLVMTVDSSQGMIENGHSVVVSVAVFNQLDPSFKPSLTLTVTGPSSNAFFDVQPISVPAGTVGEYTFSWDVPNVAGAYAVEVELVPL
jgi:hypothetical protein